jgi:thiol-disulfide isomerase/thioredoxin
MMAPMKRRDPTRFYVLGFGVIVVGLAVAQGFLDRRHHPEVGKPAPDLVVPRLDGAEWRLSDLRGKVVLIDFWARWCEPCVRQMPVLSRLVERLRDRPFQLVSINIEDVPGDEVLAWLRRRNLGFPVARDPAGTARAAYRVTRIPLLVLVAPDGVVRKVYDASASEGRIADDVALLLSR